MVAHVIGRQQINTGEGGHLGQGFQPFLVDVVETDRRRAEQRQRQPRAQRRGVGP